MGHESPRRDPLMRVGWRAVLVLMLLALSGAAAMAAALPAAQSSVCDPAPPSRLILRERARVSTGDPRPLNLRSGVGTAFERLAQIPAGAVFYVLDGPQCSQNYAWYEVEYNGVIGWIAEGDSEAYYVELYPPGM